MSPIYKEKKCKTCLKKSLHRYVVQYPFDNSYWVCTLCEFENKEKLSAVDTIYGKQLYQNIK